jgi:MFS family permease
MQAPLPNPPPLDRGLWHHADFLRLWAAQAFSAFGSRITRTALPIIAVTTLGQSEAMVGLLAALQLAPGVILAMVVGGFVDRGRKRRILIASDVIRAALVLSLTLAWALDALTMLQVILVGAGVGAASALFQITDNAYLPTLIGRRRLLEGNAKLETTEAIAEITGPASAGVLIAALGAPLTVVIDAASYLWSAFMLRQIRATDAPASASYPGLSDEARPRDDGTGSTAAGSTAAARSTAAGSTAGDLSTSVRTKGDDPDASARSTRGTAEVSARSGATAEEVSAGSALAPMEASAGSPTTDEDPGESALAVRTGEDFRIGVRAVFGHPLVRPIMLTLMVWSIAGGFFSALYTLFLLRELGLSEGTFGLIVAMGGVGSLAGAVLARALARLFGVGRTLLVTSALSVACTLFIPISAMFTSPVVTIGFLVAHQLLADGFAVAFIVLAVTLRQTVLPRDLLGRANAAVHVCTTGVLPVTALLAGGLAEMIGIQAAVWVGLSIGLLAPVFLWRLRTLKDMPTSDLGASDSALTRPDARG